MHSSTEVTEETVGTRHGDVSYPTVECAGCGQKTMTENAVEVVVGEVCDSWSAHSNGNYPAHVGLSVPGRNKKPEVYATCGDCATAAFGYDGPTGLDGEYNATYSTQGDSNEPKSGSKKAFVAGALMVLALLGIGVLLGVVVI